MRTDVCTAVRVDGVRAVVRVDGVRAVRKQVKNMIDFLEIVLAILGMLLCFLMFLVVVLRDSLSNYLDAKASELRARADSIRKEGNNDRD